MAAPSPTPSLLRLLQLASPSLPIGAYAYSQGLERVIADGRVADESEVRDWLHHQLERGLGRWDLPILERMQRSWANDDPDGVAAWSRYLLAGRESGELLGEDRQQGQALARLLDDLGLSGSAGWRGSPNATLAAMFARAAVAWEIPFREGAQAFAWGWADSQVAAAVKLVPLGQTSGQRLLLELGDRIPGVVAAAESLEDEVLGGSLPGLALASARHETQYSRLFRS